MENVNDIDYTKLIVDKENETVSYNDELHKYWTKDGNENCISVTTLIHKFTTFDEAFWSKYKALESILSPDDFLTIKKELTSSKIFSNKYLENFNISEEFFNEKRNEILAEWARKRDESCVRGTKIHKAFELEHLAGNTKELTSLKLGGKFNTNTSNLIVLGEKGVYPELLLSYISQDKILKLAGQADLIIIDGFDVYVLDYKSNKKIEMKSFYDRNTRKASTMLYPLNNIQDVNFWHYSLQLSTYAWMIQELDPRFNIKLLMLIHIDHDDNYATYECQYLKNDVERMLAYYKKQIVNDEFKKSMEKMIF